MKYLKGYNSDLTCFFVSNFGFFGYVNTRCLGCHVVLHSWPFHEEHRPRVSSAVNHSGMAVFRSNGCFPLR